MRNGLSKYLLLFLLIFIVPQIVSAGKPRWVKNYRAGLEAMKNGEYQIAIEKFLKALEDKGTDKSKIRAYGAVFIEYYPNRELGICYYKVKNYEKAKYYLQRSLNHYSTDRARNYLSRIPENVTASSSTGSGQSGFEQKVPERKVESVQQTPTPPTPTRNQAVGQRMSIAVLQFESRGLGGEFGDVDLMDKLITAFVNSGRFRVIERAQLEKILEEQKLGLSGLLDASTAAQIGKGIGVDAVVVGSVTRTGRTVSIDARLIDTETAGIIAAKDAYSETITLKNIAEMIADLGEKFRQALPVITGLVINVSGNTVTLDLGRDSGIKKGMKCTIYEEGENIVHPVTGKVIGKVINELCEVHITDVFSGYSLGVITREKKGLPKKLDKAVTK